MKLYRYNPALVAAIIWLSWSFCVVVFINVTVVITRAISHGIGVDLTEHGSFFWLLGLCFVLFPTGFYASYRGARKSFEYRRHMQQQRGR